MKASEVIKRYEAYCPQELSMEGDVCGLQVGTLQKDIHKVMVALDIREQTVAEAIAHGVDLIIVKHAPIFRPIKDLVADRAQNQIYIDLIKHDIAVYVSHTNIDIVPDGLNDWFCQLLDIEDTEPLSMTGEGIGIGRIGQVSAQTFGQLASKVKETFGLDALRLVHYDQADLEWVIECVAICGGSGQSFYRMLLLRELRSISQEISTTHTAQDMLSDGLLALDPGHHIVSSLCVKISRKAQSVEG